MPKRRSKKLKKYQEGSTLGNIWGGVKDATLFGADVGLTTLLPFMKSNFMDDHYTHDFSKKAAGSYSDMAHGATAGVTGGVVEGVSGWNPELDSYRTEIGIDRFAHGASDFGKGSVEGLLGGGAQGATTGAAIGGAVEGLGATAGGGYGALASAAIGGFRGASDAANEREAQNAQNRVQNNWTSPLRAKYGGRLKKLKGGGNIAGDPQKGVYVDYSVGQSHDGPDEGIEVDFMGQPVATSGGEGVGLTEKGEVTFNGDVFSDSVKLPGNKKRTFADEAKRITRKYKFYLGEKLDKQDEASKLGLQKELQVLFDIQEAKKGRMMHENDVEQLLQEQQQAQAQMVQQEQMAEQPPGQEQMMQDPAMQEQMMAEQMGGGMPMMQEGGELDSPIDRNTAMITARSEVPGYDLHPASVVPASKLGALLTGRRYRRSSPLLHRISNMINEPIQRREIERAQDVNRRNQLTDMEFLKGASAEDRERKRKQIERISVLPKHTGGNSISRPPEELFDPANFASGEKPHQFNVNKHTTSWNTTPISTKDSKGASAVGWEDASPDYMNTLLSGAASAIKPITGLIYNAKNKSEPISLSRVSPYLTDEHLIREQNERAARLSRSTARQGISRSGASQGATAAYSGAVASDILRNQSRASAESYTREEQRNAQLLERASVQNAQIDMQEKMFNAQLDRMDKQKKETLYANLAGIPQNVLADIRDQEQYYAGLNMQHPDLRYAQESGQPWWKRRKYNARAIGPDGTIQ